MMDGENISVSDDATASSTLRSRTNATYASTANRVPERMPSVLSTVARSRPTPSASFSQRTTPPVPGASPSWSTSRRRHSRRSSELGNRESSTASFAGMRLW